ncbi:anthocyanidin 3-O-glucoside 6''-O-acyltransferase-like [Punica granatum]|uniref:Uncharacterized protein n=2 Tax=Punica granatum TaxID=22663 RepID=A0A218WYB3_PUNGR|nr:anthocyanidin 3-O-glucoside 6''-O-acyltransferase-like [Punica granatum]OWM77201.1 hypothetical protein CDL15_Pgr028838 [Punica granatum]PKI47407.1 hypothetical protein CRG98_032242 [Punica granatum]
MAGVTVLERSHVLPLPSAAPTRLPLTFLDLPWLFFHPSQQLFFYDYPHPASHFASAALPLLKSSLSLALRLFFPLAGHLHTAPARHPAILCTPRLAGVSLTIAESDDDFHDLCHDDGSRGLQSQRAAHRFHPLVPALSPEEGHAVALMAIQITVFPGSGFSVGITYHHVAADERTFNNFLKAWTARCTHALIGNAECPAPTPLIDPPRFDRAIIRDMPTLEQRFLNEWWKQQQQLPYSPLIRGTVMCPVVPDDGQCDMVRSTFVVVPSHMELVRSWIMGHCEANGLPLPVHLSPYVLTCTFLWVVRVKTHFQLSGLGKNGRTMDIDSLAVRTSYFGYIAGGISRLGYPVPESYFGNCVGFGRAEAACSDLVGEAGIFHAATALGSAIKRLDRSMLESAEEWILDWRAMLESDVHVVVVGSPKVDFYDRDFGWGRPRKIEEVSTDWTGAISLHESRDVEGGIEVGVSLLKAKMDAFIALFVEGFRILK